MFMLTNDAVNRRDQWHSQRAQGGKVAIAFTRDLPGACVMGSFRSISVIANRMGVGRLSSERVLPHGVGQPELVCVGLKNR